jgi:hypothetical protein
MGATGFLPGSGAAGIGVVVSVRDMVCNPRVLRMTRSFYFF